MLRQAVSAALRVTARRMIKAEFYEENHLLIVGIVFGNEKSVVSACESTCQHDQQAKNFTQLLDV